MNPQFHQFLQIDFPALASGMLAAISCGVLGNFLVLRRMSLMGDAISHAVLPGLVAAFLISSSRASLPMFIGAGIAGVITVFLVEWVRKFGRLESGAAMGVVFSILFAIGVLLLEQAAARSIDLDADCVLYGQLEHIFWFPPNSWSQFFKWQTLLLIPSELKTLVLITALALAFIFLFYKELKITSFDPDLATSLGIPSKWMHYGLMIMVASAVVASFAAVGSILVIAMLIVPASIARLLTDRLSIQIFLSIIFASLIGALGYFTAAFGPFWLGWENSVSASGMITVMGGLLLAITVIFSPHYGLLAKQVRKIQVGIQIAQEDLMGILFRLEEYPEIIETHSLGKQRILRLIGGGWKAKWALQSSLQEGKVEPKKESIALTTKGKKEAMFLVRTHRLWETFLFRELGLKADHVHDPAEKLEHYTSRELQQKLDFGGKKPRLDPQGKPIPKLNEANDSDE